MELAKQHGLEESRAGLLNKLALLLLEEGVLDEVDALTAEAEAILGTNRAERA